MFQRELSLIYARRGWKVVPLKPKDKTPLIEKWPQKASIDERVIEGWWQKWPDANVGIVTGKDSGIFVVDIDNADGERSWTGLVSEVPEIPEETLEQKTGRGRQLFFRYPPKRSVRNKQNLRPGLDVRGEGGYVVAPPSIHPNGAVYDWPYGLDVPIEKAPRKLLDLITKPPEPKKTPVRPWEKLQSPPPKPSSRPQIAPQITPTLERASLYLRECEPAVQGAGGHNALLWAARAMVIGFELSDIEALNLLWSEFNPRCSPPWDHTNAAEVRDFERKVAEARRTPGEKPSGWLLDELGLRSGDEAMRLLGARAAAALLANDAAKKQASGAPVVSIVDEAIAEEEELPFPIHCLPPKIRRYAELVAETQVVNVAGVGLSILVTAGAAMGNAFRLRLKGGYEVPPILWGINVARSGSNKSGPFREIIKPLRAPIPLDKIENAMLNPQGQLLIEDATTESVIDVLSRSPRGLCMANGEGSGWVGAFDRYAQGSKKKTSVDESIWIKLYDCDPYQKNRKTDSESLLIPAAACAVITCIQPEKMAECFDPSQFSSGLVPRLMVVRLPKMYRAWSDCEMTEEDSLFWHEAILFLRSAPFASMDPNTGQYYPNIIEPSPTAKPRYTGEFNRLARLVHDADDITALFASKMQGGLGRLALVLHGLGAACGDHSILSTVGQQTMENAVELGRYFLGQQLNIYGVAGKQYEQKRNMEILGIMQSKGGSIRPRELQRVNNKKWPNADVVRRDLDRMAQAKLGVWEQGGKVFRLL